MDNKKTSRYNVPEDLESSLLGESIATTQQYALDLRYGMEILSKVSPDVLHDIVSYISELINLDIESQRLKAKFDVCFENWWKETCIFSGANLCNDNENFRSIKAMGSSVIPFIDEKAETEPQYKQRHIQWLSKGVLS